MAANRGIIPEGGNREFKKTGETCEICGMRMERDPESGEYRCPDCYYVEREE